MTSELKTAANRNNAKKSTGPRSKAGRDVSRRNARSHGLSIDIATDPASHDGIEELAKVLSPPGGAQKIGGHARQAAEAQFDLLRIRRTRAWLFDTYFVESAGPDNLAKLKDELTKLERYERRALSKRKRALHLHAHCGR